MKMIYVQNGIVFYYGNPAGYLGDGTAVIDCMFQKEELVSFVKELGFLEHVFREGVYDRLSEGGGVKETAEDVYKRQVHFRECRTSGENCSEFWNAVSASR